MSPLDFKLLFEAAPGLVLVIAPDFTIVGATDAYLHATGAARADRFGRGVFDVLPEPEQRGLRASLERVRQHRAPDAMAVRRMAVRRPDSDGAGEMRRIEPINSPVFGPGGEILYVLHRLEDREASEVARRELDDFSYAVAHDLRTPLRGMSGFAQAVLEDSADKLGAEGKDGLRRIIAAAKRMGHLIDALQLLSRIGRADITREAVDLGHVADGIIDELRASSPERPVVFVKSGPLEAFGDARLLAALLRSLLENAWRSTIGRAPGRIEIGTSGEDAYFVRDDGVGFDPAYAAKLFAPFQRLHSEGEFASAGVGIGLASVRRIVHRHGGRVWAEGAVGQGATFHFTLPRGAGG
jgi:signal transduction histidine kinase